MHDELRYVPNNIFAIEAGYAEGADARLDTGPYFIDPDAPYQTDRLANDYGKDVYFIALSRKDNSVVLRLSLSYADGAKAAALFWHQVFSALNNEEISGCGIWQRDTASDDTYTELAPNHGIGLLVNFYRPELLYSE